VGESAATPSGPADDDGLPVTPSRGGRAGLPVVHADVPAAQHNVDLFHSLRFHAVTDAVESFVTCIHART
jgi:hypothetical protein